MKRRAPGMNPSFMEENRPGLNEIDESYNLTPSKREQLINRE
jgi:hypothetical protein